MRSVFKKVPQGPFGKKPTRPDSGCETPGQLQRSKTPSPETPWKKLKITTRAPTQNSPKKNLKISQKYLFPGIFSIFEVFFKEVWGRGPGVILSFFRGVSGFWALQLAGRFSSLGWFCYKLAGGGLQTSVVAQKALRDILTPRGKHRLPILWQPTPVHWTAVLKILRRSEFTMRSKSATAQWFTYYGGPLIRT